MTVAARFFSSQTPLSRSAIRGFWNIVVGPPAAATKAQNPRRGPASAVRGFRSATLLALAAALVTSNGFAAEDIGASPLPILNCGMACQFNSSELVALDQLDPYIQDALDLIEFANGDASTPWGAKRAARSHPAPFANRSTSILFAAFARAYAPPPEIPSAPSPMRLSGRRYNLSSMRDAN
jgi:hypothetical protein